MPLIEGGNIDAGIKAQFIDFIGQILIKLVSNENKAANIISLNSKHVK